MPRKKKCKPIEDFKIEIKRIDDLISGLITSVLTLNKMSERTHFKEGIAKLKKKYPFLEFHKEKIDSVYELGFIRLYASFEAFMYEFLKYLYFKYPKSIPLEKKITVEEIFEWKTKKSIYEFIIDHLAIENSYELSIWEKTLKTTFGIEVFKDEEQRLVFNLLNLCRNMLAHSGGKTTSNSIRTFNKILPNDKISKHFKIEKFGVFDATFYNSLSKTIVEIVSKIESAINESRNNFPECTKSEMGKTYTTLT